MIGAVDVVAVRWLVVVWSCDRSAGTYIQVIGQVKDNHGKRTVMAYNIQTVKDFNMITYHFLEAMHVHALALKGQGSSFTAQASTSGLVHAAAPHGDSLLAQQAQVGDDGMSPIQQDILKVFKSQANFADDTGCVECVGRAVISNSQPINSRACVPSSPFLASSCSVCWSAVRDSLTPHLPSSIHPTSNIQTGCQDHHGEHGRAV